MKKIFFCTLLFCITGVGLKAQEPPKRVADPSPARPVPSISLPLKSGGGSGSQATVQTVVRPASLPANPGGAQVLPPSATAVKRDSLQKH
jgi:hypothetical protein